MQWHTVEEIIAEFGLASTLRLEDIRRELKAKLLQLSNETDADGSDTDDFRRLVAALACIDQISRANVLPAIRSGFSLTETADVGQERSAFRQEQAAVWSEFRNNLKRRYAVPKITSAGVASLLTLLFAFIGNMKSHPLYEQIHSSIASSVAESYQQEFMDKYGQLRETFSELQQSINNAYPRRHPVAMIDEYLVSSFETDTVKLDSIIAILSRVDVTDDSIPAVPGDSSRVMSLRFRSVASDMRIQAAGLRDFLVFLDQYPSREAHRRISLYTLGLVVLAVGVFLIQWAREQSDQRWIEYLLTEDGLIHPYSSFCGRRTDPRTLTYSELRELIVQKPVARPLQILLGSQVTKVGVDHVAELLVSKFIQRGVATKLEQKGIQEAFILHCHQTEA
jgi:hypothetical protein